LETCGDDAPHVGGTQGVCKQKAAKARVVFIVQPAREIVMAPKQLAEAIVMQTLDLERAAQVKTFNMTIARTTGALAVLVLAMDAVAIKVNTVQKDTAPDLEALDVSSMLLTDALLVLWDVMLPVGAGAPMETVHAPNLTPVQKDQTRSEWQMLINTVVMVEVVLRAVGGVVDVTVTNEVEMAS